MKYIKSKVYITNDYCRNLERWIKANPEKFFAKENEAHSWADFNFWPTTVTDRYHLIMKGEICIIDRMWEKRHAYVICQFYGNNTFQAKVRDLYRVIWVDDLPRSKWRNGYFLIPDLAYET